MLKQTHVFHINFTHWKPLSVSPSLAFAIVLFLLSSPHLDASTLSVSPGCGNTTYFQDDGTGDGLVVMEAEASTFSAASITPGHDANALWLEYTSNDAGNGAYVKVPSSGQNDYNTPPTGARLDFDINFVKTGTHHLYIRYFANNGDNNSIHASFNGTVFQASWNVPINVTDWTWRKAPITFNVPTTGVHTLTIFHREDGMDLDRIALSTTPNYPFTGIGPDATEDGTSLTRGLNERVEYHMDYRTGEGIAVIEAEQYTYNMTGLREYECQPWGPVNDPNTSGGRYMTTVERGETVPNNRVWSAPMLDYEVSIENADYFYLHVRHKASRNNNALHVAIDYNHLGVWNLNEVSDWSWQRVGIGNIYKNSGTFLLSLIMRDDATPIDKIILTTNPYYYPTNDGPIETVMVPARLVYEQDNSAEHLVELPMEVPSRRLAGLGLFSQLRWENQSDPSALGGQFAQVQDPGLVNNLLNGVLSFNAPVQEFDINFVNTGTHYLYVRHRAPSGSDNSYTYLFDQVKMGEVQFQLLSPLAWRFYDDLPTINVPSTGIHKLGIAMREDGTPIDHVTISSSPAYNASVLPVEILLLTGEADRDFNRITWSTGFEENTAWHHVERSTVGYSEWENIGSVKAAGNSSEMELYDFYDNNPPALAYYRIVTQDFDGTKTISSIVSVTRERATSHSLDIYPNPASESTTISFESAETKDMILRVVSISGQSVAEREYTAHAGLNSVELPVARMAPGSYTVIAEVPEQELILNHLQVVR